MKKRKYILKCIVSVIMIGMLVCGCGKKEVIVTEESNTEMIEEPVPETPVEEEEVIQEEPVVDDVETQESVESTEMVDWETFAAQEDNEEICLVIYNETTKTQKIMGLNEEEKDPVGGAYIYQIQEGDRFAVPIRDNIVKIWIDDTELQFNQEAPYLELELPKEEICQIYVTTYGGKDSKHFVLQE